MYTKQSKCTVPAPEPETDTDLEGESSTEFIARAIALHAAATFHSGEPGHRESVLVTADKFLKWLQKACR